MPTLLTINNYYYRRVARRPYFSSTTAYSRHSLECGAFRDASTRRISRRRGRSFLLEEIEFGEQYSVLDQLRLASKVIYSVEARRNLTRLLDAVQPDVCHAHNIYHHISPSILGLLKAREIPTVITLHDLKIACPAYLMLAPDGICERCRGGKLYNVLVHRCIKGSSALSAA